MRILQGVLGGASGIYCLFSIAAAFGAMKSNRDLLGFIFTATYACISGLITYFLFRGAFAGRKGNRG